MRSFSSSPALRSKEDDRDYVRDQGDKAVVENEGMMSNGVLNWFLVNISREDRRNIRLKPSPNLMDSKET